MIVERRPDVAVIGAGPAGMAAALSASRNGARDVMLIERDVELGGILQQCIHDGFGSIIFGEALTGPEYSERYISEIEKENIDVRLNTLCIDLAPDLTITAVNKEDGVMTVMPRAVVLAMGCRERTRHQVLIPGYRPAGVITAGAAQRYINIDGLMPGKRFVILGSGDIGMIMARRVTLEGGEVVGVFEIMDEPGGLTRNVVQCLYDYDIPLFLRHTVTFIHGRKRVEGVTVARVNEERKPILGTERFVPCDTLMLSVGLIPENELSRSAGIALDTVTAGPVVDSSMETSVEGIFACGNVINVYDLVDYVSRNGEVAGKRAAERAAGEKSSRRRIPVSAGRNVRAVVPQFISGGDRVADIYFRVSRSERAVSVQLSSGGKAVARKKAKIVVPPEMVTVRLERDLIDHVVKQGDLRVDVMRDEGNG